MSETRGPRGGEPTTGTRGSVRAEFDWSNVAPSTAVVETVAIATDTDPTSLQPLYESIDPDALDMLVRSMGADSTAGDGTVSFALDGYDVTVKPAGAVVVRPTTARTEST